MHETPSGRWHPAPARRQPGDRPHVRLRRRSSSRTDIVNRVQTGHAFADAEAALDDVPLRGGARADRGRARRSSCSPAASTSRSRRPRRRRRSRSRASGRTAPPTAIALALAIGLADRPRQRDRRRDLPRERADHDARDLDDHARPADRRGAEAVHLARARLRRHARLAARSSPTSRTTCSSGRRSRRVIILGLRYSGIGRMIYAVGDNPVAVAARRRARLAGAALRLRDVRRCSRRSAGSCSSASTTRPTSASARRSCSRRWRRW